MAGKLWAIVQDHIENAGPYGPSEAAVARRLGMSTSGLRRWKVGNPPPLPRPANLHRLAELCGQPYAVVLAAALEDAGYGPWRAPDDNGNGNGGTGSRPKGKRAAPRKQTG